jgi:hypothetical protein
LEPPRVTRRRAPLTWRLLSLLAAPYLVLTGLVGFDALLVERDRVVPSDIGQVPPAVIAVSVTAGVGVLAGMVAARSAAVHFFGYAFYSVALAVGLGYGSVRALINQYGGLAGEPPGPAWLTGVLLGGAGLALAGMVAIAIQIVVELRGPQTGAAKGASA